MMEPLSLICVQLVHQFPKLKKFILPNQINKQQFDYNEFICEYLFKNNFPIIKINKLSNINSILGIGPKKALNLYNQGYNNINKIKKGIKNGKLKVSKLVKCGLDYKNDLNIKINRKEALLIKNLIKKSLSLVD